MAAAHSQDYYSQLATHKTQLRASSRHNRLQSALTSSESAHSYTTQARQQHFSTTSTTRASLWWLIHITTIRNPQPTAHSPQPTTQSTGRGIPAPATLGLVGLPSCQATSFPLTSVKNCYAFLVSPRWFRLEAEVDVARPSRIYQWRTPSSSECEAGRMPARPLSSPSWKGKRRPPNVLRSKSPSPAERAIPSLSRSLPG
jgi:hypothetical protein